MTSLIRFEPDPGPQEGLRGRVFVVDDHAMARDCVRIACESHPGLSVVGEAAGGAEALNGIRRTKPDVVVIDLVMPDMSGFELIHRIREEGSDCRLLILSARDDDDAEFLALVLGVRGFVGKSASLTEIGEAIERVARGGTAFSEDTSRRASARIGGFARRARDQATTASRLTPREWQVLELLAEGSTAGQVAARIGVTKRTVESHVGSLYGKLGVRTRVQAVYRAISLGLIEMPRPEVGDSRGAAPASSLSASAAR